MRLGVCPKLIRRPEVQVWFHALEPQYAHAPLATVHTTAQPSRCSPGLLITRPFEILYFSENNLIALLEVESLLGSPHKGAVIANPNKPWLAINVHVQIQQVVDLTELRSQRLLATTAQEPTGDGEGYQLRGSGTSVKQPIGIAPTQDLGSELFALGIEGFRTLSAKVPHQMNLIAFPQNLLKGSDLHYHDPASGKTHGIKGKL